MPSSPAAICDATYRYGFAAGSPIWFSRWVPSSPGAPITRTIAPRFSYAQVTFEGAKELGWKRL